jgi:hypothetical protein
MFTAYYFTALMDNSVIGVIDGMPVRIPFENKPFYYKTGYLLIFPDPEVSKGRLFPPSFQLPEKPNVPLERLFPQRSFKIPEGNGFRIFNIPSSLYLTDDIQALEWFGRFQTAVREASDYAKGDYAKYCQLVADRMGVPYVSLDGIVAPRRLAPGAMTPEQLREIIRVGSMST